MAAYVLIHGAADSGWYWHLLEAELRNRGHDVVAPVLPCDDDSAGLSEYAATAVDAIGDRTGLVVVAQSFGGFTAPLVCERVPVDLLVLMAGMVPLPGEPPGDWWANTGYEQTRREQDERDGTAPDDDIALFLHDVPPDLAAEALRRHARTVILLAVRADAAVGLGQSGEGQGGDGEGDGEAQHVGSPGVVHWRF